MIKKITAFFIEKFSVQPKVFRSPGRINIIGEHTDGIIERASLCKEGALTGPFEYLKDYAY